MGMIRKLLDLPVTNNHVSKRLFYFSRKDLRALRSKVRYVDEDISNSLILKMTRKELVQKLVEHEVGQEVFDNYQENCKVWGEMKAFVEYGVTPINT
jgi:hypothetical protein